MAKTVKRYYVGPHDSIETIVGGQEVLVAYGDQVEFPAELADQLDDCPEIWSASRPKVTAAELWPPDKTPAEQPAGADTEDGE